MEKDLTKGSILKVLLRFSMPYLLSCFLQTFYGMVDLYVTGQYNGAASISAVSIGSQVMHMFTVIIVGLAMGSTVGLGVAIGSKHMERASRMIGNTVTLFAAGSAVLVAVLMLARGGIIAVMSVPEEAIPQARDYLTICFAGIPFITAYNVISCIYRGMGDSKSPMYFVGVACILNIALDFLFIGGLHMGAAGAACGTVISQAASVVFALVFLLKGRNRANPDTRVEELPSASEHGQAGSTNQMRDSSTQNTSEDMRPESASVAQGFRLTKKDFIPERAILSDILKVGVPVACQDGFIQISFLVITMIANRRGVDVAASVGIVGKIISFLFLVPSAMLSSVSAIAAQDRGAGLHDRARKTLFYAILVSVSCGCVFFLICQIVPEQFVGLFSSEETVRVLGGQYLRSYSFDCIMASIHFCFSGFFCAYGRSAFSFAHNLISVLLVRIPGAYLATQLFPDTLFPMGMAAPAGSTLSSLICVILFLIFRESFGLGKKNRQKADKAAP
ncbi:MAG: MATE family efflux transporter [Lachnospiraceae bacterium]|nr:MATE family efflux transporter [Lachnospiraceae bacterium]